MKKILALLLSILLLAGSLALAEPAEEQAAPTVTGTVDRIEKYGHARLYITIPDFEAQGFALGDIVTVEAGSYTGDMPYFNGYYVDRGEYMLRAYPGHTNIAVCINYGKFAEVAGIQPGDPVTITLKERGGALALQEINNLVYSQNRADYASDEVFANWRPVTLGGIRPGRLWRSASPVNNRYGRSDYAYALMEEAGVRTVVNLTNTVEELEEIFAADDFDAPAYREMYEAGQVIVLGLPADFTAPDFTAGMVSALTFMAEHDSPCLVHCTEGKDRAGFAIALIGALMGASADEIEADYMLSFVNYYGVEPGTERYELIAEKNVREMLRAIAGLEKGASLEGADLRAGAERYLQNAGMAPETITALRDRLTGSYFGQLLPDLLSAYKAPTEENLARIDDDLAQIRAASPEDYVLAEPIARHWRKVYLDPDYTLYLNGRDDPAQVLAEAGVQDSAAHAFVVLGYELKDGAMLPELMGRCDAAAAAANAFPSSILVCSGGATGPNNPEKHTEAGLMKDYLVEVCGIAPERVFTDERAMTTAENALNTFAIMKEQGVRTMTIVTSAYHQRWGQVLYNAVGLQYARDAGFETEILGNWCYDIGPSEEIYREDARIAVSQLGSILGVPRASRVRMPSMQPADTEPLPVIAGVAAIREDGSLVLSVEGTELLDAGYAYGERITVTLNGQELDMPVMTDASGVEQGSPVCLVVITPAAEGEGYADNQVILAIHMGSLAAGTGIDMSAEEPVMLTLRFKESAPDEASSGRRAPAAGGTLPA